MVPAQLAPPNSAFTGRARAARALDGLVAPGSPAPVAIVSGIAGVGKTALALDWAHRNVSRFPDGQLFADLRGYDRLAGPVAPHDLLGRFLRALGVNSEQIPADPDERAALYRSVLHPLRVLILLDNAASAAQVRPLLPGARGCRVVVTARPRLEDLLIEYGAAAVPPSRPWTTGKPWTCSPACSAPHGSNGNVRTPSGSPGCATASPWLCG
ncbi:hypothetical protein ACFSTC_59895 [Nonomuraea ferruginea]